MWFILFVARVLTRVEQPPNVLRLPVTSDPQKILTSIPPQSGEYEKVAPTKNSDRQCATWDTCKPGEYETLGPSRFENRACGKAKTCDSKDQYFAVLPTTKTDAACGKVNVPGCVWRVRACRCVQACGCVGRNWGAPRAKPLPLV